LLDIVSFAVTKTHQKALFVGAVPGEREFVSVEARCTIGDLSCYNRKAPITDLGVSNCHNWA
jgi:hypothetical protein